MKTALVMVDLQNDFCHGGSLAVPNGEAVVSIANQLQRCFDVVVATKDWHPHNHVSFAANHTGRNVGEMVTVRDVQQVLWPVHCVQETKGSEFHPELSTDRVQMVFHKGTDAAIDSYSAFFDNAHLRSTGLDDYLHRAGVTDVYIMGLATDYCVKYSCLDAVELKHFTVHLITDACRGVELTAGDVANAIKEMEAAGVKTVASKKVLSALKR